MWILLDKKRTPVMSTRLIGDRNTTIHTQGRGVGVPTLTAYCGSTPTICLERQLQQGIGWTIYFTAEEFHIENQETGDRVSGVMFCPFCGSRLRREG